MTEASQQRIARYNGILDQADALIAHWFNAAAANPDHPEPGPLSSMVLTLRRVVDLRRKLEDWEHSPTPHPDKPAGIDPDDWTEDDEEIAAIIKRCDEEAIERGWSLPDGDDDVREGCESAPPRSTVDQSPNAPPTSTPSTSSTSSTTSTAPAPRNALRPGAPPPGNARLQPGSSEIGPTPINLPPGAHHLPAFHPGALNPGASHPRAPPPLQPSSSPSPPPFHPPKLPALQVPLGEGTLHIHSPPAPPIQPLVRLPHFIRP